MRRARTHVTLRLNPVVHEKLRLVAELHSTTVSHLVRLAIEGLVESEKTTTAADRKPDSLVAAAS